MQCLHSLLVYSDFLFLHDLVIVGCLFPGIYPCLLGYQIYYHVMFIVDSCELMSFSRISYIVFLSFLILFASCLFLVQPQVCQIIITIFFLKKQLLVLMILFIYLFIYLYCFLVSISFISVPIFISQLLLTLCLIFFFLVP